jgi:hypothetical protein
MDRSKTASRVLTALLIGITVSVAMAAPNELDTGVDLPGFIPDKPAEPPPSRRPSADPPRPAPPAGERGALMRIPPNGDLRSLQGCWQTDSYRSAPGAPAGSSTYCFDANGRGQLTHVEAGVTCRAPAHIEFRPDGTMYLVDRNARCEDGSAWVQDRLRCRPGANGVATCAGESNYQARRWATTLHRR